METQYDGFLEELRQLDILLVTVVLSGVAGPVKTAESGHLGDRYADIMIT